MNLTIEPGQSFTIKVERVSAGVTEIEIEVPASSVVSDRELAKPETVLYAHYRLTADAAGLPLHILGDGSLIIPP